MPTNNLPIQVFKFFYYIWWSHTVSNDALASAKLHILCWLLWQLQGAAEVTRTVKASQAAFQASSDHFPGTEVHPLESWLSCFGGGGQSSWCWTTRASSAAITVANFPLTSSRSVQIVLNFLFLTMTHMLQFYYRVELSKLRWISSW